MTQVETQNTPPEPSNSGKGKVFFERAEQVAETGNWDFAIELFIEGIKREPGNIDQGHQRLRDMAMNRTAQGGKGPGMGDKFKHRLGKDPEQNLVNSAFLLAKEPGSQQFMNQLRQAASKLELDTVVKWVCDIMLESQRLAKRQNPKLLMALVEDFAAMNEFQQAMAACEMARVISPDDAVIQQTLGDLSAKYTMHKGKYGEEGDFIEKVADLEGQQKLMEQDHLVQSDEFLLKQIENARSEYLADPEVSGKINGLVDTLLKMTDESYEGEAISVLEKAHRDSGAYQYKLRIGDIKIKQMTRRYRKLVKVGDTDAAKKQLRAQLAFELEEYKERSINYPTDLKLKFELGRRQYLAALYDDAISSLQQAQRDPRHHLASMSYLGQAFEAKGWMREATETYTKALEGEMSEEKSKDLRYNLGNVQEKMGDLDGAREQFSTVAQADFNYKDVRKRLDAVNSAISEKGRTPDA
ncbi:MAG: hypothetical protein HN350_02150 [Phycisphaerales bacterium]|jgi:tetratricopeptide (TPR) repeat protein|nr:hypothetical protein [Phycisphaerales bacterium]